MYKVIDLGSSFEATGEPRVRLVSNSLVKTASTEIQDFWDKIEPSDDSSYLWVIGVSSAEYYGCNNNGDAFHEADLKNCHHHFVDTANVFLHHVNRDPAKGIGKPVFSWFNDEMHRVELILRINKNAEGARDVVAKIANNEQLFVSMGCSVKFDVCSICGNQSPTRAQYCDHLRYNLKKILPDGKQVFAWNPDPKFFDISIVRKPADPTAFALDKIASEGQMGYFDMYTPVVSSAEMGEQVESAMAKTAAFEKLSEIYKTIDAIVADTKNKESEVDSDELDNSLYYKGFTDAVRMLTRNGVENLGDMSMDHAELNHSDVSPVGVLKILEHTKAPFSLSDGAWMAAKHFIDREPGEDLIGSLIRALPAALSLSKQMPEESDRAVHGILSDYNGECDNRFFLRDLVEPHREPLSLRITIVRRMLPLQKHASDDYGYGNQSYKDGHLFGHPATSYGNKLHFKLKDGRVFEVSRSELTEINNLLNMAGSSKGLGALLGLGGIALMLSGMPVLQLVGAGAALGGSSIAMHHGHSDYIRSEEGIEVPVATFSAAYKKLGAKNIKTASILPYALAGVGAAIPAVAGLDYLYNKSRYGDAYDQNDSVVTNVGRTFNNNPVWVAGGGAIAGGTMGHLVSNAFENEELDAAKNTLNKAKARYARRLQGPNAGVAGAWWKPSTWYAWVKNRAADAFSGSTPELKANVSRAQKQYNKVLANARWGRIKALGALGLAGGLLGGGYYLYNKYRRRPLMDMQQYYEQ